MLDTFLPEVTFIFKELTFWGKPLRVQEMVGEGGAEE